MTARTSPTPAPTPLDDDRVTELVTRAAYERLRSDLAVAHGTELVSWDGSPELWSPALWSRHCTYGHAMYRGTWTRTRVQDLTVAPGDDRASVFRRAP